MAFDLDTWKDQFKDRMRNWRPRMQRAGTGSVYAFVSAAALWPVVEAARAGEWAALAALGSLLAGLGTNLLANQIQSWKDEADAAQKLTESIPEDPALRAELDAVLEKLQALPLAEQGLTAEDRAWFAETVSAELARLGSSVQYTFIGGDSIDARKSKGFINRPSGPVTQLFADKIYVGLQPEEQEQKEELWRVYLKELAQQANLLPWANLTTDFAHPERGETLRLADVYTDLDTNELRHVEREEEFRQFLARQQEVERISAQEMFNREARLLIMGDPGSGKSTFIKHVAYLLAQAGLAADPHPWLERLAPWDKGFLIPVWVELRQVATFLGGKTLRGEASSLLKYLESMLMQSSQEEFWPELKQSIRNEESTFLFLLDGLDEVPTPQRQLVVDIVQDCCLCYPWHRYVVTCRPYAYIGQPWQLNDFHEVTLAPFSPDQVDRFVENWYQQLAERGRFTSQQAAQRAARLKDVVQRQDLRGLAERPLLLTVMAQLHSFRGQLPEDRTQLYADTVQLLLQRWEGRFGGEKGLLEQLDMPGLKMSDLEAGLYAVAYHAHEGWATSEGTADIDEAELRKWLAPYLGGDWNKAGIFVDYIRERAGLLIRHKTEAYTFPHRTFQEFLAACFLVGLDDYPAEAARLVSQDLDRWREVFILAAGHAARTHRLGQAIAAVNTLLPEGLAETPTPHRQDWLAAQLAGQALLEIGLVGVGREKAGQAALARAQGWLAAALGRSEDLEPIQRAQAGRVLGELGDPRLEVTTLDAMQFCYVPPGAFKMGTPQKEVRQLVEEDKTLDFLYEAESPQNDFSLPGFFIARNPVTNAQFEIFCAAGGYSAPRFWGEARRAKAWEGGFVVRQVYSPEESKFIREREDRPHDFGAPFNFPNHPVVGVTWYEALAYTRWLEEYWRKAGMLPEKWAVLLPSEAEWEKAARGGVEIPLRWHVVSARDGFISPPGFQLQANPAPARVYPWEGDFEANDANIDVTGIGATNAVGCFPGGASPYGVLDLSGNVWEWTRSINKSYPYSSTGGREELASQESRVLRGGSFYDARRNARCAFRGWFSPDYWYLVRGFRVVVSPSRL